MQMNAVARTVILALLILTLAVPAAHAADVEFVKTIMITPMPELPGVEAFWNGKYFFVRTRSCTPSTPGYRGLWAFDEAGTLIGERDVAWDAGQFDCWQHSWGVGGQIVRVDDNGVVFGNVQNARPPIYYTIRNGKVEMISRANQNPPLISCEGCNIPPGAQEYGIGSPVAVTQNGYVIGNKHTAGGITTAVFKLPTFQEVGSGPQMSVIGAIGNYVIGWTSTTTPTGRVTTGVVYRVDSNGQFTFVKNIPPLPNEWGVMVDQWDPNRGLLHGTVRENNIPKTYWKIYEATPTDLVEVYSKDVPSAGADSLGNSLTPRPIGLAGDYIAVIAYRPAANAGTQSLWESRPVELWKTTGDQKLTFQAPPGVLNNPAMGVTVVGISKTGKVAVATHYAVYLYQIKGFQSSGGGSNGGGAPACKTAGASCAGYSDCCSQTCAAGVCVGGQAFSPPTSDECEIDNDCVSGWCNDGTCEIECEEDDDCSDDEWCEAGLCEITTDKSTTAQFTTASATCTIGTGKFYCTTPISWTSTGTGKIQLWRDNKRLLSCTNAGLPGTKNLRATTTPHEYQIYAATTCDRTTADKTTPLDTITVQGTRS